MVVPGNPRTEVETVHKVRGLGRQYQFVLTILYVPFLLPIT